MKYKSKLQLKNHEKSLGILRLPLLFETWVGEKEVSGPIYCNFSFWLLEGIDLILSSPLNEKTATFYVKSSCFCSYLYCGRLPLHYCHLAQAMKHLHLTTYWAGFAQHKFSQSLSNWFCEKISPNINCYYTRLQDPHCNCVFPHFFLKIVDTGLYQILELVGNWCLLSHFGDELAKEE